MKDASEGRRREPVAVTIWVNLKSYFGYQETVDWCRGAAALARGRPAIQNGSVDLFVLPSYLALPQAIAEFAGTGVQVGAQNLSATAAGAFTGEVSGTILAEVGCTRVVVGHAERRRLFAETDVIVAAKVAAALDAGLSPIVCVGEPCRVSPETAAEYCSVQLHLALSRAAKLGLSGHLTVAYEPEWAIGAPTPATNEHIVAVCSALRDHLPGQSEHDGLLRIDITTAAQRPLGSWIKYSDQRTDYFLAAPRTVWLGSTPYSRTRHVVQRTSSHN